MMFPRFPLLSCALILIAIAGPLARAFEWTQFPGQRRAALSVPGAGHSGFTDLPARQLGITFTNFLGEERSLTNQIFLNGSGVAAGDIDGDGWCDLYFCGLDSPNVLYRNLGEWQFEDITTNAGVACADQASTGAVFADVDGDGDMDLLVTGIARGVRLFLNHGQGKFREITSQAGLRTTHGSASLALADIDGDGYLEVYVANYRNDTMRDMPGIRFNVAVTNGVYHLLTVNGRPASSPDLVGRFTFDTSGGVLENGEADLLYRNLGDGRFASVSWTNGAFLSESGKPIDTPYDWGLSAMFRDLNGDNAPDLYVCNDFQSPDRIWINDGRGQFRAIAPNVVRQTSLFSMGIDFADLDRDGHDDFFVADMLGRDHASRQVQVMDATAFAQIRRADSDRPQFSRNMLFRSRGDGTYAEIALLSGLEASDWSWSPIFLDVDLDGYEDLLITTGHWRDLQHADIARELSQMKVQKRLSAREELRLRSRFPRLDTPNVAFRNRGDLTFEETGLLWGFNSRRISHGMAPADLDNDGDLDVIVNCLNDAPLVYRNESPAPRIAVRLRGERPNTSGVGAKIRVLAPGLPPQSQEVICGGRYLSGADFIRTFAAGTSTNLAMIEITWRNGRRSVITNAPANHLFEIDQSSAASMPNDTDPAHTPWFEDLTDLLNHQHIDAAFDDFTRQPLLPRKLSQLGPGVSWFDFNGDGWDDLFIGAGRGGRLGVFRNDGKGRFIRQRAKAFEAAEELDLTTILGWRPNPTNLVLLMGLAGYETGATNAPALRHFSVVTGAGDENLLRSSASTGPMAMADIDGDGDLDVFVGGRVRAGRFPEATLSVLLRNHEGQLRFDARASQPFTRVGLVSGATFTDLNSDGRPDLVLACEWGPIKIFRNDEGTFTSWTPQIRSSEPLNSLSSPFHPSTLDQLTGWWNSIAAGDFDGDGRLDLVAGNWGRNTSRARYLSEPLRLHFGEADHSGNLALIESHFDPQLRKQVPARSWTALSAVFTTVLDRFPNFTSFSTATLSDLLGAGLPPLHHVSAATLDSVILLNRGDHFHLRPLPIEAQFSPVFGMAAGDFDGDGREDLFLAQNFFGVPPSESRHDAGCGLWLRGDGNGGFTAVPARESGIAFYGEGRGVAVSDFDHDGRLDLVIGQNRGATMLYRNARGRPGLRVKLQGLPENIDAIGAVVRLHFRDGTAGPAHERRAGGGYWSQDSSTLVLGLPKEPESIEIRWPSGTRELVHLPPGTRTFSRTIP